MNLRDRLLHISDLLSEGRERGRTSVIAKAAKETGGIVIAHNFELAKQIERQHDVPARSMEINLYPYFGPFFLDHFAASQLLRKAHSRITELELENEWLKDQIEKMRMP